MSSIHEHLIPKKNKYKVRIVEGKSDRPEHVVYGIWAALIILTFINRHGRKPSRREYLKSYYSLLSSIALL